MLSNAGIHLHALWRVSLGQPVGQLRACVVNLGPGEPLAYFLAYGADFDVDPWHEMFYFPTSTLKFALLNQRGEVLWKKDLGKAVVPGNWFCPIHAADIDGDGVDEIYFVNNTSEKHPLGISTYVLERLDGRTGETTGRVKWPDKLFNQSISHTYRYFIFSGEAHGKPILVTAQGTYEDMHLQGRRADLAASWEHDIAREAPGARGSHMNVVLDINADGVDEVLWGERIIELASGRQLLCLDEAAYRGHSDVVQPVWDAQRNDWLIYVCRESDPKATPRVLAYDTRGNRVWGDVPSGHMDMGWTARLPDSAGASRWVSMAILIGKKTCGPDGRHHVGMEEFTWDFQTGTPLRLPFSVYRTRPIDLNGDGVHELVRGDPSGNGEVLDGLGNTIGSVGGSVALYGKLAAHPGEQMLSYAEDGSLVLWADKNAVDSPAALQRYAHPFYRRNNGAWYICGV